MSHVNVIVDGVARWVKSPSTMESFLEQCGYGEREISLDPLNSAALAPEADWYLGKESEIFEGAEWAARKYRKDAWPYRIEGEYIDPHRQR